MTLAETLTAQRPPLSIDGDGVVRVGGTRVTLETVIHEYKRGTAPEDIVRAFDALNLADVHAVISHYLRNRDEVEDYIARSEVEATQVRQEIEAKRSDDDLRARMEARRSAGGAGA